jgi:hypothetical protein
MQAWSMHGRLNVAGALQAGGGEPPVPPPPPPEPEPEGVAQRHLLAVGVAHHRGGQDDDAGLGTIATGLERSVDLDQLRVLRLVPLEDLEVACRFAAVPDVAADLAGRPSRPATPA